VKHHDVAISSQRTVDEKACVLHSDFLSRVFADTNLFIYAESQDQDKSSRTVAILQDAPVINSQVIK